jgi:hypothetical protein
MQLVLKSDTPFYTTILKYVSLMKRWIKKTKMATVTIKINTRSKKSWYLLGLINEMAKNDRGIKVITEKTEFMNSLDQSFKELKLAQEGKLQLSPAREIIKDL